MALIIATGSNIGDSIKLLNEACEYLSQEFEFKAKSRIYTSVAIEYENQPDFFNQVIEFSLPLILGPEKVMQRLLQIEKEFGRNRTVPKGPRTLDLDIIFWGLEHIQKPQVAIPHPRWSQRSFVVKPLQELPFFQTIEKCFTIPKIFDIDARPIP